MYPKPVFFIFFILIFCWQLTCVYHPLFIPFAGDDGMNFFAMRGIIQTGIPLSWREDMLPYFLYHPPLYLYLTAIVITILGGSLVSARIFGLICLFVQTSLVYFLTKEIVYQTRNSKVQSNEIPTGNFPSANIIGLIAATLYGTSPVVIQGSLLTVPDTTIVPILVLLFFILLIKTITQKFQIADLSVPTEPGTAGSVALKRHLLKNTLKGHVHWGLVFILTLLFWSRLDIPLLLIGTVLGISYFISVKNVWLSLGLSFFVSIGITILTWVVYLLVIDKISYFTVPVHYYLSSFRNLSGTSNIIDKIKEIVQTVFRLTLWLSPGLVSGYLISIKQNLYSSPVNKIILLFTMLVLIGYTIVGGVTWGYPRLYYASFPLIFCLLSLNLVNNQPAFTNFAVGIGKKQLVQFGLLLISLILIHVYFIGDPVYEFNFKIKELILNSNKTKIMNLIYKQIIGYGLILFTFGIFNKFTRIFSAKLRVKLMVFLFTLILSYQISLSLVQLQGKYLTNYAYGSTGLPELIKLLKEKKLNRDEIIAPGEILINLDISTSGGLIPQQIWNEKDILKQHIANPITKTVVYGIPCNTIYQLRNVIPHPEIQTVLKANFHRVNIGSYTVWLRKAREQENSAQ